MKRIKEFAVPRGRVPTEVSRAFQLILISLRNLDQAIDPEDSEAIRTAVDDLERRFQRIESASGRQEVVVRKSTEITYSTTY